MTSLASRRYRDPLAIDHAGPDHVRSDPLPARLAVIAGIALLLGAAFVWDVAALIHILRGGS